MGFSRPYRERGLPPRDDPYMHSAASWCLVVMMLLAGANAAALLFVIIASVAK